MDPATIAILLITALLGLLVVVHELRNRAQRAAAAEADRGKTPEDLRTARLAREAREREAATERSIQARSQTSGWFQLIGLILILVGFWFLVVDAGASSDAYSTSSVVSLQKLFIGATSGMSGVALLATGILLKYLE